MKKTRRARYNCIPAILVSALIFCLSTAAFAWPPIPAEELAKIEAATPTKAAAKPKSPRKLLVLSLEKANHLATPHGAKAIELMGEKTGAFEVVHTSDPNMLKAENLAPFDAVCFNNSNRMTQLKDPEIQEGLLNFVKSGKGFVGVHAATTNFVKQWGADWPEGAELVGAVFDNHPWHEEVTIKIEEPDHPLCAAFKDARFTITDEMYQFTGPFSREKQRVLLSLDLDRIDMSAAKRKMINRADMDFPVSWVHDYGKGRVFYCSLGHDFPVFWNKQVLQHYLDGIQFALGDLPAPSAPRASAPDGSASAGAYEWRENGDSLALTKDDRVIWQFNHARREAKPYFHPVALADGTLLTWLKPEDHPWHRALWFSWKYINKINYWEEDRATGMAKGRSEILETHLTPRDDGTARIVMSFQYYYPPAGGRIALTENRMIEISAPDAGGGYRMDWDCEFKAIAGDVELDCAPSRNAQGEQLHGGYAGLSVRLAENMTKFEVLNSEGLRDLDTHGKPARWLDFNGATPQGRTAGIAILDHPQNPRHPISWWISKMGPTQNKHNYCASPLYHEPYALAKDKTLRLRYRVSIHPERGNATRLDAEWKAFAQ